MEVGLKVLSGAVELLKTALRHTLSYFFDMVIYVLKTAYMGIFASDHSGTVMAAFTRCVDAVLQSCTINIPLIPESSKPIIHLIVFALFQKTLETAEDVKKYIMNKDWVMLKHSSIRAVKLALTTDDPNTPRPQSDMIEQVTGHITDRLTMARTANRLLDARSWKNKTHTSLLLKRSTALRNMDKATLLELCRRHQEKHGMPCSEERSKKELVEKLAHYVSLAEINDIDPIEYSIDRPPKRQRR